MILWGNEQHWYPFTNTLRQIYEQDTKQSDTQSVVVVLMVAEKRPAKTTEIIELIKLESNDLVSKGYVQVVASYYDSYPARFNQRKENKFDELNDESKLMNYRIAFLLKHCSEVAGNAMLLDSEASIADSALNKIYKEINDMKWNVLQVNLNAKNSMEKLYQGRYLPRVYGTFYSLAELTIQGVIIDIIEDASVHTKVKDYVGEALILSQKPPAHGNPSAKLKYKIARAPGTSVDYFYLNRGPSWFGDTKQGDYVSIILDEPTKLNKIYVETGLDSFKRDVFQHAVLELSYSKDKPAGECTQYSTISSFEENSVIIISNDDVETFVYLSKPVHCIKLRVTRKSSYWTSIKTLLIEKQ